MEARIIKRAVTLLGTLALMVGLLLALSNAPAKAVQNFDNAGVANAGLAEVGTARPTGWNQPGECIKSVQRWVAAAGGHFGGGGVISGYVNSGAKEVTLASAVKGDVIQYTAIKNGDNNWNRVHTVVVVKNHGNGSFDIVQSNAPAGSGKVTRDTSWRPNPPAGWEARVWRFGKVTSTGGGSNSIDNGTYIKVKGNHTVYRVAGGAPLKVYSWSGVGGSKPLKTISQSQFDSLRKYPKNGTILRGATTGHVYIVAGGSPMHVHSWKAVGGQKPVTNVDQRAINHQLRNFPENGTYVRGATTGHVYTVAGGARMHVSSWKDVGGSKPVVNVAQRAIDRELRNHPENDTVVRGAITGHVYIVAGGSPMHVSSWNDVGGRKPLTNVDQSAIDHLPNYPSNGTLLRGATTGHVYTVAGGAPMHVSNWADVGGRKPVVNVDQSSIDNHLRDYPENGTLVHGVATGRAYVVAGNAPLYINSWSGYGGQKPTVGVDQSAIDNLPDHPSDGTVIRSVATGKVYIVAGGAPMYISKWSNVGGHKPYTNVHQGAIDQKLRAYPQDGTFVRGYQSQQTYQIVDQKIVRVSDLSQVQAPVVIDDWAITNQLQ